MFMEMKKSYAKINEDSVRSIEKESIDREKQMHDWWFDNDDPLLSGRIKEIEGSTAWNHRYLQHSTLVQQPHTLANIIVSKMTQADEGKSSLTFVGLGVFTKVSLRAFITKLMLSLLVYAVLGFFMWREIVSPLVAAFIGSAWTWLMFIDTALKAKEYDGNPLKDDKFWGGLLAACAVFMLFYFK